MTNSPSNSSAARSATPTPGATKPTVQPPLPLWAYLLGLIGAVGALYAAGALVYSHFTGVVLPGCGTGQHAGPGTVIRAADVTSSCASNLTHPMGSLGGAWMSLSALLQGQELPRIRPHDAFWPISHLGATYFAAVIAAWLIMGFGGRRIGSGMVWLVRLGMLMSAVYVATIIIGYFSHKGYCPYCVGSHTGNFVLWASMEFGMLVSSSSLVGRSRRTLGLPALLAGLATFVLATGALGKLEHDHMAELEAKDRAEAERTEREIRAQAEQAAKAAANTEQQAAKEPWGPNGFRGRYLMGPEKTPVRLVMLTDYQCPDCRVFEGQAFDLLKKYEGKLSLSIFHFPMEALHANAVWAARAAEAGAIIAGSKAALEGQDEKAAANEAFWKLHKWLFEIKGSFTRDDLIAKLPQLGFADTEGFFKVMTGGRTEQLVKSDQALGDALGLYFTPMMFVNGIEVRGWITNPNALTSAVDAAIAANPPAADAKGDKPVLASQKYFEDWTNEPKRALPQPRPDRTIGPSDAPVQVLVFGDYNEPNTKKVDALVRSFMKTKPIRYEFRHYPGARECNPSLPKDFFVNGCLTAKAAEAAGKVGGADGFWKMHEFLFQNNEGISLARIGLGAKTLGLDAAAFDAAMASGEVGVAVQNDVMAGQGVGLKAIPTVYVNGKRVERWDRKDDNILERIIDHAAKHKD